MKIERWHAWIMCFALLLCSGTLLAHGVDDGTRAFLEQSEGAQIIPFLYIGAKHMITGYDHLLFLFGVIFFLYRRREILLYVTAFTVGHSITLLFGVLNNTGVNPYIIDAIIGFSVLYKGFDNLGGFKRIFGFQPNTLIAVLIFGLFHGFGLATKLQDFQLPQEGLLSNLIAFNVGVEVGQFSALAIILLFVNYWRNHRSYHQFSKVSNTVLMSFGFMLIGYQLVGYSLSAA